MVKFFKILFVVLGCCMAMFGVGQDMQFESVSKLPATINTACEEILPIASPDGKTLYFARVGCDYNTAGKMAGSDIWFTVYNSRTKEWSRPGNKLNELNDKNNNAIVGMSGDGKTLYLTNTAPGRKIKGVYFSKREGAKWGNPQLETIPFLETEEYFGLYVSPDLKTIIASMKREDGRGEEDLYVSRKDGTGKWSEPKNLGEKINTAGFEISPFLTKDTKRLYFASNGHRGLGGSDIFYSDRLDDTWTSWSVPVNVGNVVNTEGFDAYFSINDSVAWFSSRNNVSTDIYRAKVLRPEDLRKATVSNIVNEANSMLADLNDDTYDSLSNFTQSVFVSFEKNTAILSADALAQLDEAVALIRKKQQQGKQGKLSMIAYTNSTGAESGQLWDKRLEEIRKYLRKKSGLDLMIDHEIWRVNISESAGRGSVVEVRYN